MGFHNHGSTFEAIVSGGAKRFSLLPPISAEVIEAAGDDWSAGLFRRLLLPTTGHRDTALLADVSPLRNLPLLVSCRPFSDRIL